MDLIHHHRLEHMPALEIVPTPVPSHAIQDRIADERARLLRTPGRFDGPALVAMAASTRRIRAYRATYAWANVIYQGAEELGLGLLGVRLWLTDGADTVWQLRAPGVVAGGTWDVAAAGAVEPGQSIEDAVRCEASEELGLTQLPGLRPRLLGAGPCFGAVVVFSARLAPGVALAPAAAEVSELARARTAPGPLGPHSSWIPSALAA